MRRFAALLVAGLALGAHPARALSPEQIVDLALPILDPDLAQAKPFVTCVLNNGTSAPALQACAKQTGMSQANKYVSGNSTLSTTVAILKAIQKQDWVTVLDLGSTDLLFKLTCKVGLVSAGPLKDLVCGPVSSELSKLAKPVVSTILICVRDGTWGTLLSTLVLHVGPTVACSVTIIPTEVRLPVCTGLDLILKGGLAAFKAMLDGLGDELNSMLSAGDRLLGSAIKKLTPKQYFAVFWAPYLAKATGLKMTHADAAYSQLLSKVTYACPDYYGKSAPCDAMKTVFNKAVNQAVLALQSTVLPYYDSHLKGDLLYHHLVLVGSKGNSIGFGWAPGNSCPTDLYKLVPLPSGDGDAAANPSPWSAACGQVGDVLKAELEKNKAALSLETESLLKKGCNVTTSGGLYCPNYPGHAACLKLLPTHPNACGLDQDKAAQALADEILKKLGPKRCAAKGATGWEHKILECTRPWKRQACQGMVASATPAGVNDKVSCNDKTDGAYDQGKAKALQVVQLLNSGKVFLATGGGPPSILGTGTPYTFKPAFCKPLLAEDPLKVECQEWAVASDVAAKVPFVSLPTCPPDLAHEGVDAPCFARVAYARSAP